MEERLLRVLHATVGTREEADGALRRLRRLAAGGGCALLFCDLPASSAARDWDDGAATRRLQSGVMAMNARAPGRFFLLVRRRAWDDAARAYLGAAQPRAAEAVVAAMLTLGREDAAFEVKTFAPAAIMGRFDAMLFVPDGFSCAPDTPGRMLKALRHAAPLPLPGGGFAGRRLAARAVERPVLARVLPPLAQADCALASLLRAGFSLSPLEAGENARLAPVALRLPGGDPALYGPASLLALAQGLPLSPAYVAEDCRFVHDAPLGVDGLLSRADIRLRRAMRRAFSRDRAAHGLPAARLAMAAALLPAMQVALLLLSGALGAPALAAAAVALPEFPALVRPRLLPGALVRTALLPAHAALALQAFLDERFARAPLLRPRVPQGLRGASGCSLCGAALLAAGFAGAGAAAPSVAVALLWLGAPLLFPALASPRRERIPLAPEEQARLQEMAAEALSGGSINDAMPAPRRMLALCAELLLGLREADDAATQAQSLLGEVAEPISPADRAALLSCAQLLRERMGACDAVLRPLPAQIEAFALRARGLPARGPLAALLRASLRAWEGAPPETLPAAAESAPQADPLDALFLPVPLLRALPEQEETLPLTHPHTFLRRAAPELFARRLTAAIRPERAHPLPTARCATAEQGIFCASAALSQPFAGLLARSPVTGPCMSVLAEA